MSASARTLWSLFCDIMCITVGVSLEGGDFMSVVLKIKVENCIDCPYSERHQMVTHDSFEHDVGVFCSKVEDDEREHHTYDGIITKKLIFSFEWPSEIEVQEIPDWCPYKNDAGR